MLFLMMLIRKVGFHPLSTTTVISVGAGASSDLSISSVRGCAGEWAAWPPLITSIADPPHLLRGTDREPDRTGDLGQCIDLRAAWCC